MALLDRSTKSFVGTSGPDGIVVGKNVTSKVGFYGVATPVVKPTVTGSRGANAALTSLLVALAAQGLVIDATTA